MIGIIEPEALKEENVIGIIVAMNADRVIGVNGTSSRCRVAAFMAAQRKAVRL